MCMMCVTTSCQKHQKAEPIKITKFAIAFNRSSLGTSIYIIIFLLKLIIIKNIGNVQSYI